MRDYYVEPIFSTPLYSSKIEIQNELSVLKSSEFGVSDTYGVKVLDINNYSLLNMPDFKNLKHQIDEHVERYAREVMCIDPNQKFYMVRSWGVKLPANERARTHWHCNSIISGVCYLDTDDNSGSISFKNDGGLFGKSFSFDYTNFNYYNSETWSVNPQIGDVYLFPSRLSHSIGENKSAKDRYSIAFDYWVRGTIGDKPMNALNLRP